MFTIIQWCSSLAEDMDMDMHIDILFSVDDDVIPDALPGVSSVSDGCHQVNMYQQKKYFKTVDTLCDISLSEIEESKGIGLFYNLFDFSCISVFFSNSRGTYCLKRYNFHSQA